MSEEQNRIEEIVELSNQQEGEQIKFVYKRSNFYREVIADGAFGGMTPNFDIHISFYNQHYAELTEHLFMLNADGTLGAEIKTDDAKIKEVFREVEIGVTLNVGTAISLIKWLTGQVREAQKAMGLQALQENSDGK